MQSRAHAINPRLAFLPVMYFGEVTPRFAGQHRAVVDGGYLTSARGET
ncbi:MAG: hypothetical protein ABSG68_12395 [Thermoguttaceae bacterium]